MIGLKMTDRSVINYAMPKIAASQKDAFYERRRLDLIEAAVRLWAVDGYGATPVAKIAIAAGIAKGTFYLYFDSKQALLDEVLQRYTLLPRIEEMVSEMTDSTLDEAIASFVRTAWRHLHQSRDLMLVALRELPGHLPQAQAAIESVLVPGNKLLAEFLGRHLPPARAQEISLIVAGRGLLGMIILMFITQEILGAGRFLPVDEDDITATITRIFLRGVLGSEEPIPC